MGCFGCSAAFTPKGKQKRDNRHNSRPTVNPAFIAHLLFGFTPNNIVRKTALVKPFVHRRGGYAFFYVVSKDPRPCVEDDAASTGEGEVPQARLFLSAGSPPEYPSSKMAWFPCRIKGDGTPFVAVDRHPHGVSDT